MRRTSPACAASIGTGSTGSIGAELSMAAARSAGVAGTASDHDGQTIPNSTRSTSRTSP